MSEFDVVIDPKLCRSMGVCVQIAPDAFDLDEKTGTAVVISPEMLSPSIMREAVQQCPTRAIKLVPRASASQT